MNPIKVEFCLKNGLNVLLAISPKLAGPHSAADLERETFRQLAAVAPRVADWSRVVLAYELGTGATAPPAAAQRTLASVRNWIRERNVISAILSKIWPNVVFQS